MKAEMHFKNRRVGKLPLQDSLLIHLNDFETCTVLFSGFLKRSRV